MVGTLTWFVYQQRARAERYLALARKAVDESLSSAGAQQSREAPDSPEMEEFRGRLLDKAQIFYLSFARQEPRNENLAAEMAMAHSRLGDIDRLRQVRPDAVKEYDQAIAQFEKLSQAHPGNQEYLEHLAYCHNWLGETLRTWLESEQKPGQYTAPDASKEYDQAIALQQRLHQDAPANRAYQQELARSYYNLGILLYDGHGDPVPNLQRAVELLKPLVVNSPAAPEQNASNPDPAQDLARVDNNLGVVYLGQKELEKAADSFEQAIASLASLRAKEPANREYKAEAATYYNNLALTLGSDHQFSLAAKASDSARDLTDELAKPSPALDDLRARVTTLRQWIDKH
jgi:tetratricopeptide (TPR) repeat protein